MQKISTSDKHAEKKLFHDEQIDVYPMRLSLDKIHFWPQNNRTLFTFHRLERLKKKALTEFSIEEITLFVAERDIHQLPELAESIKKNGVRVPLIITDDGILLDGNRRYFACQWLKKKYAEDGKQLPEYLSQIPVYVIRKNELNDTLKLKILAEANFISDLSVKWSLDAQARAVDDYYKHLRKEKKMDHDRALAEVVAVFAIQRQRAEDLLDTLALTLKFIKEGAGENEKLRRREIVEDQFVYFWEFRNKAMKGRRKLDSKSELTDVTEMFFVLMAMGPDNPIKSLKQIEPLIQSRRHPSIWSLLTKSNGAALEEVIFMMGEIKGERKADDKIRNFLVWLKDTKDLTSRAKTFLREVAKLATKKSRN